MPLDRNGKQSGYQYTGWYLDKCQGKAAKELEERLKQDKNNFKIHTYLLTSSEFFGSVQI
jgi:hypothetical protein